MGHVRDLWTDPKPVGARTRPRNARWGLGKRWLARWTEDGRERSKAFPTREAADLWVAQRDAGMPMVRRGSTMTVRDLAGAWRMAQLHHRPSTQLVVSQALESIILPTLGDIAVGDLDRVVLQSAVVDWTARWSASRVRVAWSHVTSMLRMAEADGLIDRRPQGVRTPRVITVPVVPLTDAQVLAIADAMPDRWRPLVIVGAASGLRSGELRGLTWDRIQGDVLVVDRQLVGADRLDPIFGPPKSAAGVRRVRVAPVVLEQLGERGEGLVWRTRLGTPLTRTAASEVWRNAITGMGLRPRSGWHELRHYHASLLIADGLSVRAVADRLGHADPAETLRTYSHLWPTDEGRAITATAGVVAALTARTRSSGDNTPSRTT